MKESEWAVCPRIDDLRPSDTPKAPKVFENEVKARHFLNSRVPWPSKRFAARKEALRRLKLGEIHKLNFPQYLIRGKNKDHDWEGPVEVKPPPTGSPCPALFSAFLPPESLGVVREESIDSILERVFAGRSPRFTCLLADDWNFASIEEDSRQRAGHEFAGRRYASIAEIVLKGIYDLQNSLRRFHPQISCAGVADFFRSWQLWKHIAEFSRYVGESKTAELLAHDSWKARREAAAARDFLFVQFLAFAHEINPLPPKRSPVVGTSGRSRPELRDSYLGSFSNEIIILDLCWAAGQHYSEWKRWLRGSEVLKDGSAPDLAFRKILMSGQSPNEYRKQPRPKGWK